MELAVMIITMACNLTKTIHDSIEINSYIKQNRQIEQKIEDKETKNEYIKTVSSVNR